MEALAWPSGGAWTIGGLKSSPEQLTQAIGLEFERDEDELGPFDIACLEDDAVGQMLLQHYLRSPASGTDVLVDAGVQRDVAIQAVKRRLGLGRTAFEWTSAYPSCMESLAAAITHTIAARAGLPQTGQVDATTDSILSGSAHKL